MDGTDGGGTHIWLRYATQFTVGERTQTIEMGIPVPVGASTEMRERLFREAEAGMNQLVSHVERQVAQMQKLNTFPQNTTSPAKLPVQPISIPANKLTSPPNPATASPPTTSTAAASLEAPQTAPPERKEAAVPPTRPNIAASMPRTPNIPGDSDESLKLPQFIQFIKDSLGLTPKQAMDLLKVKTLSGLNLREALEQLQQFVAQEAPSASPSNNQPDVARETKINKAPDPKMPDIKEIRHAVVRDNPSTYAFEEEIDLDGEEEEEIEFLPELTDQERAVAEEVLDKLKEARGSSAASSNRLTVLHNVINDQISEEQLLQIIEGVWGVTTLKKLKNEQVEALISWAKAADDFISEADMVLALIQEEQYARSDR